MDEYFRYKTAIVRGIAQTLSSDALKMDPNSPVLNQEKAIEQFKAHVHILRNELKLNIIELPADDSLPDCVFVEDVIVAVGNRALMTTPGHVSRQPEVTAVKLAVTDLGMDVIEMSKKDKHARMDGGDVLFTGQEFFIGTSTRTNDAAVKVLADTFPEYPVTAIPVSQGLHLKSCCSSAGPGRIILGVGDPGIKEITDKVKETAKFSYEYISIGGHTASANCLYIHSGDKGKTVVYPKADLFIETDKVYENISKDITAIPCDLSEMDKVDGALTCCSVLLTV